MRKFFFLFNLFILFFIVTVSHAQQIKFTQVIKDNPTGGISSVTQDRQGYIWFVAGPGASSFESGGLYRYDGVTTMAFRHDAGNANSPADKIFCIAADSSGIIWMGAFGAGLDRYDPSSNTFTHFRHDNKNSYSLANDTVTALLVDHNGDVWAGTLGGLDKLDKKTGRFIHYKNRPNDTTSLSADHVGIIYEDRERIIWVGCGFTNFGLNESIEYGGLNRFNAARQNFTRYLHNPADPKSIANNKVRSLMEDSKGNFWVGTNGDGLHIMNRKQGTFTHYYYDAAHPEKLSRPPLDKGNPFDYVTFIKEDITGAIWVGSLFQGVNRYDPNTQKIAHYGFLTKNLAPISAKDTASGLNSIFCWSAFISKDGLLWISSLEGNLYTVNPLNATIPYFNLNGGGNSFYKEPRTNVLWIATQDGLVRTDIASRTKKVWRHDPLNHNSLCNNGVSAIRIDAAGNFWLTTQNGLSKFEPATNNFTTYRHSMNDTNSLSSNNLTNAYIDRNKNIWLATADSGLDKFDVATNTFTHFKIKSGLANTILDNYITCIDEDREHNIWFGTSNGIKRLNNRNVYAGNYLAETQILAVYADAKGAIWAGSAGNLYRYDSATDNFLPFINPFSKSPVTGVLHIIEDEDHNLWVATASSIIKINESRNTVKEYGTNYGVHKNTFLFSDNFRALDGQLIFGDQAGYYAFYPGKLKESDLPPAIYFTGLKLGDSEIVAGAGNVLQASLRETKEIKLSYDQNVFSFDFAAPYYTNPGGLNYAYKLENYDNEWHSTGTDRTARFFSVPPGTYTLHVRAAMDNGLSAETSVTIVIKPPWWATWWFRALSVIAVIIVIYAIIKERSKKLTAENLRLEQRVTERTAQLQRSLEDLKSTQAQLIQSEKMASLGELTAGIAHEIQNPLNFVNNFSEVNREMIAEMKDEINKGNYDEVRIIADDIEANEEKINHHGKRADAIVKGMLQHSRKSEGKKEPTDINALCDEYLRLAYHGLRAKDKEFNAEIKTEFDRDLSSVEAKINIVSQDIGRVLLNLYNNAFYAVSKPPTSRLVGTGSKGGQYKPLVSVTTRKITSPLGAGGIEIKVADNGNGIPQNIVDKIFQPFFTTKPTGSGTGLGLSLSYDIVKAHGGEIKVNTKEGEGSEFIIMLPI